MERGFNANPVLRSPLVPGRSRRQAIGELSALSECAGHAGCAGRCDAGCNLWPLASWRSH
jgi:hypothetical protein